MTICTFCKIVKGQSPSKMIFQDERVSVFHDIHHVAPVHILIVPNKHIERIHEINAGDRELVGHMFFVARQIAEQEGIAEEGYRLIINNGEHGGQVIYHLHLHLIGGRPMRHPMG